MGLIPPPPFEQCLEKLHNWCGMASLILKKSRYPDTLTVSLTAKIPFFFTIPLAELT